MRSALAHAPAMQRTAVAAMLKTIFAQETKSDAEAQRDNVADALREKLTFMDAFRDDVRPRLALAAMGGLKLFGMGSACDEIMAPR